MTPPPSTPHARPALPAGVVTLSDHEQHAHGMMDDATWAYLFGAAADELTFARNIDAWQALELLPRVLKPLAGGHTRVELLGRTLDHPILVAPMAYQRLAHPDGEHATALAAAALGAGLVFSTQASAPLDDIAATFLPQAGRGPLWFQLYLQPDRGFTQELVKRAEAAGYEALVLTVDAPVQGPRDRERRAGFRLPANVSAANLAGLRNPPPSALDAGQSALFDDLLAHAPTWDDVAWLRSISRLPVLLKGILHPDDARQAITCGAAGLIVSNHGGRTLDTAVATAAALPRVAAAAQGDVPVSRRPGGAGGPPRAARSGERGRHRCGPCVAPAARRARDRHGAHRLPHAGPSAHGAGQQRSALLALKNFVFFCGIMRMRNILV
jgi:4-hydroxymandelate oxidase